MLHDPEEYPEPEKFVPERFIKDGKINPAVMDPTTITSGFGRRSGTFVIGTVSDCSYPPSQNLPWSSPCPDLPSFSHRFNLTCLQCGTSP